MSNEKNPYYNQSGCADPTAYKAVKAVSKEDAALEGRKNFSYQGAKIHHQ